MVSRTSCCIFRRLGKECYKEVYGLTYALLAVSYNGMSCRTRCTCVGDCKSSSTPELRLCEYASSQRNVFARTFGFTALYCSCSNGSLKGFLVGVLLTAVIAVMWSHMHNTLCIHKVLSKIWEVNITRGPEHVHHPKKCTSPAPTLFPTTHNFEN
jgi:hypothetical protein